MFIISSVLALFVFCAFVDSRVILLQDTPISSEGVSMKISLKEDKDASGRPVASIQLIFDDEKSPNSPPVDIKPPISYYPTRDNSISPSSETIPNFDDRSFMNNGKCAIGYVWRGNRCRPTAG